MFDLVVIGHIAKDIIIREGSPTFLTGGASFYASIAARKMGGNVGVVSKIGRDLDENSLFVFNEMGIQTFILKTDGFTTSFEIEHLPNSRRLRLIERCAPILFEEIPDNFLDAQSILVSPIAREISPDFMKKISRKTDSVLAIDLQGFVRKFGENGNVYYDFWNEGEQILPLVDIVKSSKREALTSMNCNNIYDAAQEILSFGPEIVIITMGEEGVYIRGKENLIITPKSRPEKVVETTGAGDIFFGVFLLEYIRTKDVKNSGNIATNVATKSVAGKGMSRFISREMAVE
ncbi:MAG: PfkB family carbohydrate kinase [Candidatus Jordarchaeum sp.]|uniref:PfkB family carbohydrate kinase n=1 Tax=Candidatus Jordarchaeum sp. TaxID=2823881 RepID=UPI00404B3621